MRWLALVLCAAVGGCTLFADADDVAAPEQLQPDMGSGSDAGGDVGADIEPDVRHGDDMGRPDLGEPDASPPPCDLVELRLPNVRDRQLTPQFINQYTGDIALAWLETNEDAPSDGEISELGVIRWTVLSMGGQPLIHDNGRPQDDERSPVLATLGDEMVLAGLVSNRDQDRGEVHLRVLSFNGDPKGGDFDRVVDAAHGEHNLLSVVARADGALFAWDFRPGAAESPCYTADGGACVISAGMGLDGGTAQNELGGPGLVTGLAVGGLGRVVAWIVGGADDTTVRFQQVGAEGAGLGGVQDLDLGGPHPRIDGRSGPVVGTVEGHELIGVLVDQPERQGTDLFTIYLDSAGGAEANLPHDIVQIDGVVMDPVLLSFGRGYGWLFHDGRRIGFVDMFQRERQVQWIHTSPHPLGRRSVAAQPVGSGGFVLLVSQGEPERLFLGSFAANGERLCESR